MTTVRPVIEKKVYDEIGDDHLYVSYRNRVFNMSIITRALERIQDLEAQQRLLHGSDTPPPVGDLEWSRIIVDTDETFDHFLPSERGQLVDLFLCHGWERRWTGRTLARPAVHHNQCPYWKTLFGEQRTILAEIGIYSEVYTRDLL